MLVLLITCTWPKSCDVIQDNTLPSVLSQAFLLEQDEQRVLHDIEEYVIAFSQRLCVLLILICLCRRLKIFEMDLTRRLALLPAAPLPQVCCVC